MPFDERELSYNERPIVYHQKVIEFKKHQQAAFEKIMRKFNQRGTKVILVQAPVTKEFYASITADFDADHYFSSFGDYLNFNQILHLSSHDHFFDSDHLNQNGVEIFNRWLLQFLNIVDTDNAVEHK